MVRTVLKNISATFLSLFIISIIIFLLSKAVPGDPIEARLSLDLENTSQIDYEKEYEVAKRQLGLHLPPFYFAILPSGFPKNINSAYLTRDEIKKEREKNLKSNVWRLPRLHWYGSNNQYHQWIFNPGNSIIDGSPVRKKISRALVWTLFLVFTSVILSYGFGILIALGLSNLKNRRIKNLIESSLFALYAIPVFWLATLLLVFFTSDEYGSWTNIFPSVGLSPIDMGEAWYIRLSSYGKQLILPSFILVVHSLAFLSMLTKRNLDKSKRLGFVQTAKAYGFSERETLWKEVLPFSLIPLITSVSSSIPSAIGGSLVIEIIFNIPGVGRLLYNAILNYDWPVVFPVVMLIALITIIFFFLADVLYKVVDPRIK